jgi:ATP-dependent protease ClpP protease subunit
MVGKISKVPREWYRITCQADATVAEIWIYDVIGESIDYRTGEVSGVSVTDFLAAIRALPSMVKTLKVHINSPGGEWAGSIAIANMLRELSNSKKCTVETITEALAASGASIVFCAGDTRRVASNSVVMIHNPAGWCMGGAKDMRSLADGLDAMRDSCVATYRWVSNLTVEAIQAMMDAATWMSAKTALESGFATEIMEPVLVTVCFDSRSVKALGEIPEEYRERVAALTAKPETEQPEAIVVKAGTIPAEEIAALAAAPTADVPGILAECKAAGCLDMIEELVTANASREQAKARATEAKETRGLCAAAKLPDLADGYIKARMSVADVQTHLTTITAKMDAVEIITTLPVNGDAPKRPASRLNPSAIYAERNARAGQKGA